MLELILFSVGLQTDQNEPVVWNDPFAACASVQWFIIITGLRQTASLQNRLYPTDEHDHEHVRVGIVQPQWDLTQNKLRAEGLSADESA